MNLNSLYYVCCMLHPNSRLFSYQRKRIYTVCCIYLFVCVSVCSRAHIYTHTFKLITQTGSVWNTYRLFLGKTCTYTVYMYYMYTIYRILVYFTITNMNTYMMGQWNVLIHSSIRYVQARRLFIFFIYSFIIYYDYMSITPSLL